MAFVHSIGSTRYVFENLRELLAKATPSRSGDMLAGLAAEAAREVAALLAMARLRRLTGVELHQDRRLTKGGPP